MIKQLASNHNLLVPILKILFKF